MVTDYLLNMSQSLCNPVLLDIEAIHTQHKLKIALQYARGIGGNHWIIELQFFVIYFSLTLYPIGINLPFSNREYTHKGLLNCQVGRICPERV